MKITGNTVTINSDRGNVFDFLIDASNIKELLPSDKVSDFRSTKTECSFKVQGGITISLLHDGSEGHDVIFMKSGEGSPFPFELKFYMSDVNGQTEGFMEFDGEVNAFLKMMVQRPLTNLFNYMSERLVEIFK